MAVYLVKGARDNVIGNIADAGPFEVYLDTETTSSKAGHVGNDLLVHDLYDATDSKLEDINIDGNVFTDVVSKDSLNAGIGLTTSVEGPKFIFRSVSNCTNGFEYIPPSPTPTPTVTPSVTPSPTPTISVTPSVTPTTTPSNTPSISITPTISVTPSITPTVTVSTSVTPSISVTPSSTPSISVTPSISITPTISTTPGVTPTPSQTPPNSPPNSPPAVATSNGQVSLTGTRSSSGTITGTITVSMTSWSMNSHVHVDIYGYGNGGYGIDGSAYYVSNASSVSSNPTATYSISDSDWADYANGGGTVTVRATLYLNSDQQDVEYIYLSIPAAPPPPSATPTVSATPSPSKTPPVSPTPSPSKTPPNSPASRNSTTIYNYGTFQGSEDQSCCYVCNNYSNSTTVYYTGNYLSSGDTVYTHPTNNTTLEPGYFEFDSYCWYSTGYVVYEQDECDDYEPCNVYSVIEGTMIRTSLSSSVAVEDLQIGDKVLSKHIPSLPDMSEGLDELYSWESDNAEGNYSDALVVTNNSITVQGVRSFNNGALITSKAHNHIIKRDGKWKVLPTKDVVVGDIFQDINGDEVMITSAEIELGEVKVYSLNVETDDVYYANDILTHNDS